MGNLDYKAYYRRNLPHVQPPGATFFVTFRLTGTVPRSAIEQWAQEKRQFELEQMRVESMDQRVQREREHQRRRFAHLEQYLDKADHGPVWLQDQRVARLVADCMLYRDGKVYQLDAFSIMPNHVHIVFTPLTRTRAVQPNR